MRIIGFSISSLIELHGLSDMIINFLNSQFDFSDVKIRKL